MIDQVETLKAFRRRARGGMSVAIALLWRPAWARTSKEAGKEGDVENDDSSYRFLLAQAAASRFFIGITRDYLSLFLFIFEDDHARLFLTHHARQTAERASDLKALVLGWRRNL